VTYTVAIFDGGNIARDDDGARTETHAVSCNDGDDISRARRRAKLTRSLNPRAHRDPSNARSIESQ